MKNTFLITLITLLFSYCDVPKDKKSKNNELVKDGISKTYRKDGKLLAEVNMKGGKRNGLARNYFPNGKVSLEMTYVEGKREGKSLRYYEDGTVFQESFYKNDKLNGDRKKFRENGKLMSVTRIENNLPCNSLTEYLLDGSKKTDYPSILFTPVDNLSEGVYKLRVSLSNKSKAVNFYLGNLTNSGCFDLNKLQGIRTVSDGVGEIYYDLMPGQFIMEEVNVVAKVRTSLGNEYFATATYNLAIRN